MAKKNVTQEKISQEYERRINELRGQVAHRETLIRTMQTEHNRSNYVAEGFKNKIKAMTVFIESFNANWEGFKATALDRSISDVEFDDKTEVTSRHISRELDRTFGAPQFPGIAAKPSTQN